MKRFDLWKLSLLNVFSSPVRSMLTVLGFAIGVAAILAVLTLGDAGRIQVESEMGRLGIDRIWLTAAEDRAFEKGTGEWLAETIGVEAEELVYLPAVICAQNGESAATMIVGCDSEYLKGTKVKEGRMLRSLEWKGDSQTVLMGEHLASKLDVRAGEFVTVSQNVYEVCGILYESEGVSSVALGESAVLPIAEVCRATGDMIHEIQLRVQNQGFLQSAQKNALSQLERQGYTADAVTMQVQMEAASSVIDTFVNVLKWVAMICVLVGGVGVMNILLVSIHERKREIGVMKSMGTTSVQICTLFMLEALVYAAIGGFSGILLGIGLIDAAGKSIDLFAFAGLRDCLFVFLCAVSVGLFFGVVPAYRASKLTCVDALRQE